MSFSNPENITITTSGSPTSTVSGTLTISDQGFTTVTAPLTWSGASQNIVTLQPIMTDDYAFFIAPQMDMITAIVKNVILGTFNNSSQRAGYNYGANLPQGGFIPPGQQAGNHGSWTNGLILDDNGVQMALGIDYWSKALGLPPTDCYNSCRRWFASTFTLANGSGPITYNPSVLPSRREIYLGNVSPVYRKITNVTGTTSQVYWATSNTPDGQNHGPNSPLPCVTAFPQGQLYNSPSNMEGYGGRIILDWLVNPIKAASEFDTVMKTVRINPNGTGDVSGVYGGGMTRSVIFTLFAARVTGFWRNYKAQCQALLNTLRAIKGPNGGLPQTWNTNNPTFNGNEFTPEPNGQFVMLTDPNAVKRFT